MIPLPVIVTTSPRGARTFTYRAGEVVEVTDGDTVKLRALVDVGREVHVAVSYTLRVLGIDAPDDERRPAATAFARQAFPVGTAVDFDVVRFDKYGGRHQGNVRALDGPAAGKAWADVLLRGFYAVPYSGGKRGSA